MITILPHVRWKPELFNSKRWLLLNYGRMNSDAAIEYVTPRNVTNRSTDGNGIFCGSASIVISWNIREIVGAVFSVGSVPRLYHESQRDKSVKYPCGGGVEYLHRNPASRRRRRKGKSQIWDSKIWSRVSKDSEPRGAGKGQQHIQKTDPSSRHRERPTKTRP
jgi:hypothetical protein